MRASMSTHKKSNLITRGGCALLLAVRAAIVADLYLQQARTLRDKMSHNRNTRRRTIVFIAVYFHASCLSDAMSERVFLRLLSVYAHAGEFWLWHYG